MNAANNDKLILWVDDDSDMLVPQKENLIEAGYKVQIEPDIDKVIEILKNKEGSYHGIILDVMMNPGKKLSNKQHKGGLITGLALIEYLHAEKLLRGNKIFLFSHRIDADTARKSVALNINYYNKQNYKGKRICGLVKQEFGAPDE